MNTFTFSHSANSLGIQDAKQGCVTVGVGFYLQQLREAAVGCVCIASAVAGFDVVERGIAPRHALLLVFERKHVWSLYVSVTRLYHGTVRCIEQVVRVGGRGGRSER